MYIQKAEIKNIRSIIDFEIEFKNPAGWHVLIGDNGAGKSTIIRSMALVLVGKDGLHANWNDWLNKQAERGEIALRLFRHQNFDKVEIDISRNNFYLECLINQNFDKVEINNQDDLAKFDTNGEYLKAINNDELNVNVSFYKERDVAVSFGPQTSPMDKEGTFWEVNKIDGFFSVAFGPYRRFEGDNEEWRKNFENPSFANLAAHLSVFGEDVAFTQTKSWMIGLFNTSNDPTLSDEERKDKLNQLEFIKELINSEGLLPNNTKLESVNSKDVFFKDGNDTIISVNQMSDGYRSILSMTFELIRQLVRVYGSELVFKNIEKGEMFIDLPGVVLVDEIDAHLHPTWQTRIGQWFLKYFPRLQFIVTTHSPLVCRAAENGSIWRLAAPGSKEKSREIIGKDRELLIYGNILDAISTGVFGDVAISEDSNDSLKRLAELNVKSMMGLIEDTENAELQTLRAKFPTENKIKK